MPCECESPHDHCYCGMADDVSVDDFVAKFTEDGVCWNWLNRTSESNLPGDKKKHSFHTNMIGCLVSEDFTPRRLEKVKRLAEMHPELLNSGKHPPLIIALDQTVFDDKGALREKADGDGMRWIDELVSLGSEWCHPHVEAVLKDFPKYAGSALFQLVDKIKQCVKNRENAEERFKMEKSIGIEAFISHKTEAVAQLAALEGASVEEMYGPLLEKFKVQITKYQSLAAHEAELSQRNDQLDQRYEKIKANLQCLADGGPEKTEERDALRKSLSEEAPLLIEELGSCVDTIPSPSNIEESAATPYSEILSSFVEAFNTSKEQLCSRLRDVLSTTDAMFSSLSSLTAVPDNLSEIAAQLQDAVRNCTVDSLRAAADRVCPREALVELGEDTEKKQAQVDELMKLTLE